MKKLSIYLIALVCLTLTACGKDKPSDTDNEYQEFSNGSQDYYNETTTAPYVPETTTAYVPEEEYTDYYEETETEAEEDPATEAPTEPEIIIESVYDIKDILSELDSSNVINFKVECQNGLSDGDIQVVYVWSDPDEPDPNEYDDDFWGQLAAEADRFKAASATFYINNSDKPVVIDAFPYDSEDGHYLLTALAPGQVMSQKQFGDDVSEETLEKYRSSGVYYAYELNEDIYKNIINQNSYNSSFNPQEFSTFLEYIPSRQKMKFNITRIDKYDAELLLTDLDEWCKASDKLISDPTYSKYSSYDNYNNCNIFYFGNGKLTDMDDTTILYERVEDGEYLDDDLSSIDPKSEKAIIVPRAGTSVTP